MDKQDWIEEANRNLVALQLVERERDQARGQVAGLLALQDAAVMGAGIVRAESDELQERVDNQADTIAGLFDERNRYRQLVKHLRARLNSAGEACHAVKRQMWAEQLDYRREIVSQIDKTYAQEKARWLAEAERDALLERVAYLKRWLRECTGERAELHRERGEYELGTNVTEQAISKRDDKEWGYVSTEGARDE